MFKQGERGHSAFTRTVTLPDQSPGVSPKMPKTEERFGVFDLSEAASWNQAEIHGAGPVSITTAPQQWAFAALFPIHDDPEWPLAETGPLLIRIEAVVERGEVGISVAEPTLRKFIAPEKRAVSRGMSTLELTLNSPAPGCWLVVRNYVPGGVASKVAIHSIRTFLAPPPPAAHSADAQRPGLVPLESLVSASPPPLEAIPPTLELGVGGVEVFDTPESQAINRARLEHLATLGLPIEGRSVLDVGCGVGHLSGFFAERGCRVVCVDARVENLKRLAELYPGRERRLAHVEKDSLEQFGRFDIVFCYGLIYHSENPIAALRNIASCCQNLLLLETVVTDHFRPIVQLADEPVATVNQAASGFGSRPSPAFIAMALSRMGFPFVYATRTVPNHPDFHLQWQNNCEWRRDGHLLRCVFLASRTRLDNPQLVPLLEAAELGSAALDFQPLAAPDGEVWLDVGAHLGEKTFPFATQNPNARVYAFEPNLKTASKLMGRLRNYIVLPMAVSEEDASARFYLNGFDGASSLLPFVPEGLAQWVGGEILQVEATPTVPTIRLDTFLNQAGIAKVDYLKIDARGADLAVVRSLGERLKDVGRISLEVQVTSVPLYRGASQRPEVIEFLTNAGFELAAAEQQSLGQEENLTFIRRNRGEG